MRQSVTLILFLAAYLWVGCQEDLEPVTTADRFVRVYEDPQFSAEYYALDARQMPDGGFLILGRTLSDQSAFGAPFLIRVNREGKLLWQNNAIAGLANPMPPLIVGGNGEAHFFAMDALGTSAQLARVDEAGQTANIVRSFEDVTFPLAAGRAADGNYLLLGYDQELKRSILTKINSGFAPVWTEYYDIQEDVDAEVLEHLTYPTKKKPFFVGSLQGGGYFFNGFSNYTFATTFVNASNGSPLGVVNGFRRDAAVSGLLHLGSTQFAMTHYAFGKNYLLPQADIDPNAVSNSSDYTLLEFPELLADARVQIRQETLNGKPLLLFGATTKNQQGLLLAYDPANGSLLGNLRVGGSERYDFAAAYPTADGGLMVLTTVYVASRFPRVGLFKYSKGDVAEWMK